MAPQEKQKNSIAQREEKILSFWNKNQIFKKTLEKKTPKGDFVFYDGPPFATGTPHYGHLVASAIKDVIPRYKTMRGYRVERQWGWDCHGLPIENIVEKELGTKTKKDIERLGVGEFNRLCREKIFSYVDVWNTFIPRFGRWADMGHPYRTMNASYMESEWWAFKELYKKGLLYRDYRSLHICPRCETTLAQAEVADEYKTIKDLAVTAKFELEDESNTYLLAWTTTPWTLPGNVALAINKDFDYVKIRIKNDELGIKNFYILAKNRLSTIKDEYEIEEEFKGRGLVGKKYKPLFDEYARDKNLPNRENGWKVYAAPFVTTSEGTGIVHIAPAFGQDDLDLAKKEKLPFVQHVGMDGVIKDTLKELAGKSVKPAGDHQATDIEIIKILARKRLLFSKEKYEHSYPHCWRCEAPLLNFATHSWFVAVQKIKPKLMRYAQKINWFPPHIKKGRWGEWLAGARDWSISRQRFWANTIPVWVNQAGEAKLIAGSVEELKKHVKVSGNKYFIMRHGQAEHNILNVANSSDGEKFGLTEQGKKEVVRAAKKLKKEKIDLVFHSPFRRVRETVKILEKELGIPKGGVKSDERLREVNVGIFDNKKTDEYHAFFSSLAEKFTKTPPNGENLLELKRRMTEFLYDIEKRYSEKNILIVSHEYPLWLLVAGALGMTVEEAVKEKGERDDYITPAEARELSFVPIPHNENYELDLHRPFIDEIEVVDKDGRRLKRTPDVLDTWFNSGSVPFSSYHYPFENKTKVKKRIPADFIGEGQDQVSKWFYYQHVLAGALFGKHAFKNVVVNGIVLAEDGKKMSKRLQNYPDPAFIVDRYGADAVRLYLLSSPVVAAENLNFSESGVAEISRKVLGRLENVYAFYALYKDTVKHEPNSNSAHVLDAFIINAFYQFHGIVTEMLDAYRLDAAARAIADFVDELSTWYIRRSRERFKSDDSADKKRALETVAWVLREYAKLAAPFIPFVSEWLWQNLKPDGGLESVHLESWSPIKKWDISIMGNMAQTRTIVSQALKRRSELGINVRQPLAALFFRNDANLSEEYLSLIKDELNVLDIQVDKALSRELDFDSRITPELKEKGQVREIVRFLQDMRREANFKPREEALLLVEAKGESVAFVENHKKELMKTVGIKKISFEKPSNGKEIVLENFSFVFELKHVA